MIIKEIIIKNESGLHARPAALFVKQANKYKSSVHIEVGGKKINGKSMISVLSGGIKKGRKINLIIEGEDEDIAEQEFLSLIESNFGE